MKDRQHREAIQEIFFTIAIPPKSISTKGSPEKRLKKIVHIKIFFKRPNSAKVNSSKKAMPENSKKIIHIRNGCFTKSISNTEQPIPETTRPRLAKSSTTKRQTDFKFKRVYKKNRVPTIAKMANEKTFNEKQQQHNSRATTQHATLQRHTKCVTTT